MRRAGIAEWLLKRAAGPARGTAVYGDLTEMAGSHDRVWFWFAYTRTLFFFTWRTPVAVLAAILSIEYLRSRVARLFFPYWAHVPGSPFWRVRGIPYLAHFSWNVSWYALLFLWIVLPYVAIRFGLRNRLTCLAGILFLLAVPAYTFRPHVYQLTGLACALIVVAALASTGWRRQMIFLIANCVAAYLVFYFSISHPVLSVFRYGLAPRSFFGMRIDEVVSLAMVTILCPLLYRWLLQPRSEGLAHA